LHLLFTFFIKKPDVCDVLKGHDFSRAANATK